MGRLKQIAAFLLALLLFLGASYGAGALLRPLRTEYGSLWPEYLEEAPDSLDVLFFGSSLVYCDVIPAVLWQESGLRSFVLAGPEQTLPISYYYIREALKTQSPKAVVLEVTGVFYGQYQNYTKANIDYMPLSGNRLGATFAAAEPEERPGLLFPLLNYHSRWTELTAQELKGHFAAPSAGLSGYTLLTEAQAGSDPWERSDFAAGGENYARNLAYLTKIRDLCAEKGTALLLYIAPSVSRIPAEASEILSADLAAEGLTLTDWNTFLPEMGIDNAADWYDPLHFNVYGAEKFSRRLGDYLLNTVGIVPGAGDESLWSGKVNAFESALAAKSMVDKAAE